jgi:hypothetical protein
MSNWSLRYANELCGCGEPAAGKDAWGENACDRHIRESKGDFTHPESVFPEYVLDEKEEKELEDQELLRKQLPLICRICGHKEEYMAKPQGPTTEDDRRYIQNLMFKINGVCTDCGKKENENYGRLKEFLEEDLRGIALRGHEIDEMTRMMRGIPTINNNEETEFLSQLLGHDDKSWAQSGVTYKGQPHMGSWSERYAMAKGDSKETLIKKISEKPYASETLYKYNQSTNKLQTCRENANYHRDQARNGKLFHHAVANWWNELGDLHQQDEQGEKTEGTEPQSNILPPRPAQPISEEQARKYPHYIGGDINGGWMPGTTGPKVIR